MCFTSELDHGFASPGFLHLLGKSFQYKGCVDELGHILKGEGHGVGMEQFKEVCEVSLHSPVVGG